MNVTHKTIAHAVFVNILNESKIGVGYKALCSARRHQLGCSNNAIYMQSCEFCDLNSGEQLISERTKQLEIYVISFRHYIYASNRIYENIEDRSGTGSSLKPDDVVSF
jgi:hypothetical protein